ncbi:MAG: amidohydrolase family protein, partial [Halobacteriales archaeon]|nr:amidohydrolase family protein [Halobacteriales archaeon]
DYLLDVILDGNDDFYGLAQIAMQDPARAAEEIDRVADEPGIVGLYVIPMGTPVPIGDPLYNPVYEAAEDHDLTVAFHPHGTIAAVDFPKQYYGFNRYISVHTLGFVWGNMQMVVSLIEQAVPVKFPDLTFAFLEGDVGWVPGLMFRLNKEYAARRDEIPLLEAQPEEYIKEFYFASQPLGEPADPSAMLGILNAMDAPRTLMFSSDYPHWDFDNPSELFRYLGSFTEDERERILGGNATEAFGLDG